MNKLKKARNPRKSRPRKKVVRDKKSLPVEKPMLKIKTSDAYELVMKEIDHLMKKGEENLSDKELRKLESLSQAAELYEDIKDPLPIPTTLPEMIRMKLFQLRIKQQFAAKLLGVSEAKFSLIMNGKQKPDIFFIKALHQKLNLDAHQLLEAI